MQAQIAVHIFASRLQRCGFDPGPNRIARGGQRLQAFSYLQKWHDHRIVGRGFGEVKGRIGLFVFEGAFPIGPKSR